MNSKIHLEQLVKKETDDIYFNLRIGASNLKLHLDKDDIIK